MSLRILFADDSMTAQNMGKKILTDAGYDVVAVSNGAAAVKKIAEQKPDIIILDIYMPGYSGLEVCEKVRASMDTLKTPVLLTVGKMEPYRPEDANRVRADGVIIKPFEASDLIAIVKKLEERVVPKTVAIAEQTVLLERPPEFASPPAPEEAETHSTPEPAQGIVDVPDHMATAAAFSDLLGMDSSHSLEPLPPPKHVPEPELQVAAPAPEEAAVPEFSFSAAAWSPAVEPPAPIVEPTLEKAAQPMEEAVKIAPPGYAIEDTQPIPVYEEPELNPTPEPRIAVAEEQHANAEPAVAELHVEPVKPLVAVPVESFHPEPLPVAPGPPAFAGFGSAMEANSGEFTAKPAESHRSEPVASVAEPQKIETGPINPHMQNGLGHGLSEKSAPTAEDDFEARVAAAMSIYDQPVEEKLEPEPVVAYEIEEIKEESLEAEVSVAPNLTPFVPETPSSFEYRPPVTAPAFGPIVSEVKAEVEPEHPAVAVKPVLEPEVEPKKSPVVLEAHPLETGKIPHSAIQKMVEQYAAARPAPAPVIEPDKPPFVVVHPEAAQPVVEKTSEHHSVAAVPTLETESRKPLAVPVPHPVVHEEVSHAVIEKAAAPATAPQIEPKKPATSEEPHPAVQDEVSAATIEKIAAGIEAELPMAAAASAAEIGAHTQIISQVVHRVMERLKPELIEEISRELKNRK